MIGQFFHLLYPIGDKDQVGKTCKKEMKKQYRKQNGQ